MGGHKAKLAQGDKKSVLCAQESVGQSCPEAVHGSCLVTHWGSEKGIMTGEFRALPPWSPGKPADTGVNRSKVTGKQNGQG